MVRMAEARSIMDMNSHPPVSKDAGKNKIAVHTKPLKRDMKVPKQPSYFVFFTCS